MICLEPLAVTASGRVAVVHVHSRRTPTLGHRTTAMKRTMLLLLCLALATNHAVGQDQAWPPEARTENCESSPNTNMDARNLPEGACCTTPWMCATQTCDNDTMDGTPATFKCVGKQDEPEPPPPEATGPSLTPGSPTLARSVRPAPPRQGRVGLRRTRVPRSRRCGWDGRRRGTSGTARCSALRAGAPAHAAERARAQRIAASPPQRAARGPIR